MLFKCYKQEFKTLNNVHERPLSKPLIVIVAAVFGCKMPFLQLKSSLEEFDNYYVLGIGVIALCNKHLQLHK